MADIAAPPAAKPWPVMSLEAVDAALTAPGSPFEMDTATIRGVPTRVWRNAPPTLRETLAAGRAFGDRTFLVYEDERVSFDAFHRAVAAFAAELRAQGVAKGDRVAVVLRNLPEWPVAFYAAAALGAIAVPLNGWWTAPELEYGLVDSGAKVAVMDAERHARLAEHLSAPPDLQRVYVARAEEPIAHPKVRHLEQVLGETAAWADLPDAPLPAAEIAPDDPAVIFYTSGTTGRPKGALGTHRNINSNILSGLYSYARHLLRRGDPLPAPDPDAPQRATLISIPFFHVTGFSASTNPALAGGGKVVMMRKWDPVRAFQLIERERVTQAGGVPFVAWQLIEHPERGDYDLSSLEAVTYGGAPSSADLGRRIEGAFPNARPGNGWGMTETMATCTHHMGEDYIQRPTSCGPPVATADIRVCGPDGATLPPGEVGELHARGPMIVAGYWNKPEATAATFVDGWVRTGDLARIDTEGFCHIVDRAKDMLIRGGENIYCVEVENALYEHPAVMDAAVVGRPHRTLGEEPVAVVTLTGGADSSEDELRGFVAERLAAFKVPVKVVIGREMLPRNENGKILKAQLKALFAEGAPAG